MSRTGQPILKAPRCAELRLGIVVTRWHERVTAALLDRACAAVEAGIVEPTVVRVPGIVELAVVCEGTAVGNGVLTCDAEEQALDRCGLPSSAADNGFQACIAALQTALVLRGLRQVSQGA